MKIGELMGISLSRTRDLNKTVNAGCKNLPLMSFPFSTVRILPIFEWDSLTEAPKTQVAEGIE